MVSASSINPLALRAFPLGGGRIPDVSEIQSIAGIFSPSRGDARRAEGQSIQTMCFSISLFVYKLLNCTVKK